MTRKEKRLQKMRKNPRNVTFDELVSVFEYYGFTIRQGKGSHWFVRFEIRGRVWKDTIDKPHGNRKYVNAIIVNRILKDLDEIDQWLRESEGDNE